MSLSERLKRLDDRAILQARLIWWNVAGWYWGSRLAMILYTPWAIFEASRAIKRIARVAEKEGLRAVTLVDNFPAHVDKWDALNMGPEDVLSMWENMGVKATNQFHRILTDPGLKPHEVAERVKAIMPTGTKVEVSQVAA